MSLDNLLTTIQTQFDETLKPNVKTIKQHAGSFHPATFVEHKSFAAPAVFYGAIGLQELTGKSDEALTLQTYQQPYTLRMTAMCIGKHAKSDVAANIEARTSALALLGQLHKQNFGLGFVTNAIKKKAEAVAYGRDGKTNLAFWRVEWWHTIALDGESLEAAWAQLTQWQGWDGDHQNDNGDTLMKTIVEHSA